MKLIYLLLTLLPAFAMAYYPPRNPHCECALVKCPGDEPALCRCQNSAAIACSKKCGGKPKLRVRPPRCPKPSATTTSTAPTSTVTPCATLLGLQCSKTQTCINDPRDPTCLIAADCAGVCVTLDGPFCGGFGNLDCPREDQFCIEDPEDSCDPENGGADCGGTCVVVGGGTSA